MLARIAKHGGLRPEDSQPGAHRTSHWQNLDGVEYATLEWVDWFNHRRVQEPIGTIPPAEFEEE